VPRPDRGRARLPRKKKGAFGAPPQAHRENRGVLSSLAGGDGSLLALILPPSGARNVKQNLLHELHRTAGALLRPADEASPLLTYGDVPAEYAAAHGDCVLFDETDRGLVRASGADARELLHRLLANDVQGLGPGEGNRNLLLTAKGKVRFEFELGVEEDRSYRLSAPAGDGPGLRDALEEYLFTEAVELAESTDEYAPLLVLGPRAAERVEAAVGISPAPSLRHARTGEFAGRPLSVTTTEAYGEEGLRLDAGPEVVEELWKTLVSAGARPAGRIVADALRVESCSALAHEDIDDGIYPQEARLENAFNLSKGCYIGQEVVAKIDTYGGLNKRLCSLRVTHDDPIPRGTRLYRPDEKSGEWRDLGVVTTWASAHLHEGLRRPQGARQLYSGAKVDNVAQPNVSFDRHRHAGGLVHPDGQRALDAEDPRELVHPFLALRSVDGQGDLPALEDPLGNLD